MARLRELEMPELNAAQRAAVASATEGKRGRPPAPMRAWLRNGEMAQRIQHLGELLRYDTSLPPLLSELAILVTARHWTSQYEWYAHKKIALAAGMDPAIVGAIAQNRVPAFADAESALVYRAARAVHEEKGLDDALYAECVAVLGETALAELVALLGYYSLVAMTLNVFDIGVPEGAVNELA